MSLATLQRTHQRKYHNSLNTLAHTANILYKIKPMQTDVGYWCQTLNTHTCCVRSPWILVAGNPFIPNQCSNASAPFLVSTKTSVNACCSINKNQNLQSKLQWTNYTPNATTSTNALNIITLIFQIQVITFPCAPFAFWAWIRSIKWLLLSDSCTNSTLWTIKSVLEPTLPTARKM